MRLSIIIYDESSYQTFNNTLIILLNTLDKILNSVEKFLVEISIKKFVCLNCFGISNFKFFWWKRLFEWIALVFWNIILATSWNSYKLTRLALNYIISSNTLYNITLVQFAIGYSFLYHFPFLIKILVCQFILTYNL